MFEHMTNDGNREDSIKDIISIKVQRSRIRAYLFAAFFMTACSLFSFFAVENRPFKVLLLFCTLFFLYSFVNFWKIKGKEFPILAANEQGITDNSSALSAGFIAWQDVEEVKKASFWGNHWIGINLKPYAYKKYKINSIKKVLYKINKYLGGAEICISLQLTDDDLNRILQELQSLWQRYKG